nr:L-rhamnose/proton symporter RhaT [Maribacter luteus]
MPYNKVKSWAWESYWMVDGAMSWLIVPPIAAWLTIFGFTEIISSSSNSILSFTF